MSPSNGTSHVDCVPVKPRPTVPREHVQHKPVCSGNPLTHGSRWNKNLVGMWLMAAGKENKPFFCASSSFLENRLLMSREA